MIVKIDKLSHDFRGISRINDKVLFIPSVLPEEVVDVRITIDKKNYSIGKAMNIITESSNRERVYVLFLILVVDVVLGILSMIRLWYIRRNLQ